jgi:hypothetical protein
MQQYPRLYPRRSSTRARWRLPLALAGCALALAPGTARAATFFELHKPVFLGTGETSWIGKGGSCVRGEIDVASGYYSFLWPIVNLRGRHPFALALHFTSGDNSNGPAGKGTSLSCAWFLAQSPVIAGSPYILIAPGGRQFVFDSAPDAQGNYRNSRDPDLLGAALTFTATPPGQPDGHPRHAEWGQVAQQSGKKSVFFGLTADRSVGRRSRCGLTR